MPAYYPIALSLRGRIAVVIADGALAEGKVRALLAAGARVALVSERPTDGLQELAAESKIELRQRAYREGDLRDAYLAIAAPPDRAQNRAIWSEAESLGVLLNAVDDVEHCHFIAPAIVNRGPVTVAVSTSGASPALAVRLRDSIARVVRPEHGQLATILGEMRESVARRVPDLERRKQLWFDVVDSDALCTLASRSRGDARSIVERLVARAETVATTRATDLVEARGAVTLVGAGPGRPGLVTVEGLRAIRCADAVVYDRLVHPALLRAAPVHARRIFAGKAPRGDRHAQDWINETLISLAREGLRVVRLKGGDPFVFGRGAEECAALSAAGIPYRVVPGISSAIAAPGAAGIPVTHREHAAAFVVVAGERAASASPVDWAAIARIPTIVVMMGVFQLRTVLDRLQAHGLGGETPAAIVASATRSCQRTLIGTVATLADQADAAAIAPPATLIVGDVVRAAPHTAFGTPTALAINGTDQ
jgi:uroporphyrin-III C-methyltransferase/precorrin-2 dehydrogenase/sirohydrochlorin ferrochelatase